ncbi:retinol dehydrogenase 13 isoform X1 [Callorhinus ursinus]|uniref:NADP-retinol dehydrogenase n=2 Tax=Otariidae TaxID=9702 RepID=A0A3Q7MDA5_CALUR|nr:retinol dehydrogenase 13 [Callorhinus ursinus]XP_025705009.1 retinol dehydrogenase 13 [Callorhinus ursinus]XP_027474237.1 retinol dehydrogenase 13 isoform X1 [Zalophus californianus]
MNRYLLPLSVLGTAVGGAVLLRDYVAGGVCPSKASIPGKTVIVTGANTGIGKQTALELARRGGNIILACRDMEKCEAAAKDIRGETLNHHVNARHLDLASLKSIREFAAKIIEEEEQVHILINNAAVMRCPRWTTEDGFEMQFGVNHLGHFLLTNLLLDKLKASAPSRIINLSSLAHIAGHIDFDDLNWEKRKYDTKAAYCQSKLAVILFTRELSRRLQGTGVTVNALHPGVARTELGRHTGMHSSVFSSFTLGPIFWMLVKSPQLAAQPSTYLAVAEELEGVSGKYFDGLKEKPPAPEAEDEEVARRLWAESARLVGLDLSGGSSVRGQPLPK